MSQTRARSHSGFVYAIVGAVAMTVFSWIPFAPVVGGAIAGYFEAQEPDATRSASNRGLRVGGIAGAMATIPVVVVFGVVAAVFGVAWLSTAASGEGGVGLVGVPILAAAFGIFVLVMIAAYHVALGALGGWLGAELADADSSSGGDAAVRTDSDGRVERTDRTGDETRVSDGSESAEWGSDRDEDSDDAWGADSRE